MRPTPVLSDRIAVGMVNGLITEVGRNVSIQGVVAAFVSAAVQTTPLLLLSQDDPNDDE
jgi:hypothetical protein